MKHSMVGTDKYVVTPKAQGERDKESKADLSKSARGQKSRAVKNTREAEKAEAASFKLNRKAKF